MTKEQQYFITKALQTGIPAIAGEHVAALEEIAHIAEMPQEELNEKDTAGFELTNQPRYDAMVKVIKASFPYMYEEYLAALNADVDACNMKFGLSVKAREAKAKAEAEAEPNGDNSDGQAADGELN